MLGIRDVMSSVLVGGVRTMECRTEIDKKFTKPQILIIRGRENEMNLAVGKSTKEYHVQY